MAKVGIVMGSDSDMPVMSTGNRILFLSMQRARKRKASK